jgi:hypothetical protein
MYGPSLASCAVSAINVESAWHLVGAIWGLTGCRARIVPGLSGGNPQWRGINKDR